MMGVGRGTVWVRMMCDVLYCTARYAAFDDLRYHCSNTTTKWVVYGIYRVHI